MDAGLNELLKWSIENSATTANNDTAAGPPPPTTNNRGLRTDALAALLGGPSDADLMRAAVAAVSSTDAGLTTADKLVAFDNLEQLIESLDNANNLGALGLWTPLLSVLESPEPALRRMAAWCVGTAVQNNEPCQDRLLAMGAAGLPRLVALATAPAEDPDVRRKAIYALSSAVRNYQPAMDACAAELRTRGHGPAAADEKVDATDMAAVDAVMDRLKEQVVKDSA